MTAAELIGDLSSAFRQGRLAEALSNFAHPHGSRSTRSCISAAGPLTAWGRVLPDGDLAFAIVDRILERGRFLTPGDPSMRTRQLGLDDPTSSEPRSQVARISGICARLRLAGARYVRLVSVGAQPRRFEGLPRGSVAFVGA
ncbi:MAG: hypothetical protein ACT4OZ_00940 [Gemmatimonadota bacterium]